jgi:hypothetical protein
MHRGALSIRAEPGNQMGSQRVDGVIGGVDYLISQRADPLHGVSFIADGR